MTSVKRATRKESAPVLDSYHPDEESPYEVFEEKNKEKKGRNMLHKIVSTKFSGGRSKSADRHTDHIPKKVKCQCKKIQVELGECECKRVQKVREKYDGYIKHFQIKVCNLIIKFLVIKLQFNFSYKLKNLLSKIWQSGSMDFNN